MKLTAVEIGLEGLDGLLGFDALCLFVGQDERPLTGTAGYVDWRLCGGLSRILQEGFFTGTEGESLLVPTGGRFPATRVFVVGLGARQKLDAAGVGRALERAAAVLAKAKVTSVALEIPGEGQVDEGARVASLRARFLTGLSNVNVAVLGTKTLGRLLAV